MAAIIYSVLAAVPLPSPKNNNRRDHATRYRQAEWSLRRSGTYTQKVEWNYGTNIDSLRFFWIRMTFWNHSTRDLTRGSKGIESGNSFYQIYPTHEVIGPGFAYEITRTIGRSFLWRNNRYISLIVEVNRPCGGHNTSLFQLVKAYN